LASAKNFVVLDEPTNHLDIPSAERLEAALAIPRTDPQTGERLGPETAPFAGTLVLISHDRALIDATCDHLIALDGRGSAEVFHGNYSAWARSRQDRQAPAGGPARSAGPAVRAAGNGQPRPAPAAAA